MKQYKNKTLELTMKQYFTGFFTAACLTTSLFLFVGAQNNNTQNRPLIIAGERGTTRIGGGFIEIDGPSGKKLFEVLVDGSNHGQLSMFNKNGRRTSSLSASEEGDGGLQVHNNSGTRVVDIRSSSFGGFVRTYNSGSQQTAYLGTFRNNKGGLMTYNETFDLTAFVGTSDKSDGKIALFNHKGNNIVRVGALYNDKHTADGYVSLRDRYGDYGWRVSGKNEE